MEGAALYALAKMHFTSMVLEGRTKILRKTEKCSLKEPCTKGRSNADCKKKLHKC